jgi:hypothetical protein
VAAETIRVQVGDIEVLVETVETTAPAGSELTSRLDDAVEDAKGAFQRAQEVIAEIAASTVQVIEKAAAQAARPDRLEVDFGVKFSASGNVLVAAAASEATLAVRLTYETRTSPETSGT